MDDLIRFFSLIFDAAASARAPVVLAHSSLSSFGLVDGGAETVVAALRSCARARRCTVMMPFHSLGDARANGRIAALFGTARGAVRSGHPELAFAGIGPLARRLVRGHRPEYGLGEKSPVGKLYAEDASVLMLGTGYETCTVMHLAEYRLAAAAKERGKLPDLVTCAGRGKTWTDIAYRTELFPGLGSAFERAFPDRAMKGPMPGAAIGGGREWRLVGVRDLVDFCVDTSGYLG